MNITIVIKERDDAIGLVDIFLIEGLKKLNCDFDLFVLKGKGSNLLLTFINYFISSVRLVWHYIKKSGIIYFSAPDMYGSFLNLFIPFRVSISTIHHLEPHWRISFLIKRLIHSFDYFVGTSEFSKNQLIDMFGVKKEKIFINYCGISKNYYPEKIGKFKPYSYILYVGDEYPRKNLENILKAFKLVLVRHPGLKFIKVGRVKSDLDRKRTDALIEELNLKENILLLREFFSEDGLRQYYSNAEVFMLPSLMEGFAQTSAEAMACGCPIITSNFEPMTEAVGDTQILVDPQDYKQMSEKIIEILENKEMKDALGRNAIERTKMFTWEKYAAHMQKIFNSIPKNNE